MKIVISDYIGKRYNHWKIIKYDIIKSKEKKHTYFICECDCGTQKSVALSSLKRNISKSCGCSKKITSAINAKKNLINLSGKKFGKLTVISQNIEKSKNSRCGSYWNCICDCGNNHIVSASNLKRGYVQSCGCLISSGELKIKNILTDLNYIFFTQFSFMDLIGEQKPLKFDFCIKDKNDKILFLIEYQGKQHYDVNSFLGGEEDFQKRLVYDNKKVEYCKRNNYPLIIIPYTQLKNLNKEYLLSKIEEVML